MMMLIKNRSGVVLIVVLWTLAILSLLALGLSKRSSVDISLMRNSIGKFRAYAAARAGIGYVENLLVEQKNDKDTLYELGFKYEERKTAEDVFKHVKVDNDTHFDILFSSTIYGVDSKDSTALGIQAEDGRLNLNAIDGSNYMIFQNLLEQLGVDRSKSEEMAIAVIDWHKTDTEPFKANAMDSSSPGDEAKSSSKDEFYMSQSSPYKCKSRPFDSVDELMFVKGMTKELVAKLKDFVTIFPKNPDKGLKINFKAAPNRVIEAFVIGQPSLGLGNDEDLVTALIAQRDGYDNKPFTSDDGKLRDSSVSALEQMHINALSSLWGIETSQYYRIQSLGTDTSTGSKCLITAIIETSSDRSTMKIVYWHRN